MEWEHKVLWWYFWKCNIWWPWLDYDSFI